MKGNYTKLIFAYLVMVIVGMLSLSIVKSIGGSQAYFAWMAVFFFTCYSVGAWMRHVQDKNSSDQS